MKNYLLVFYQDLGVERSRVHYRLFGNLIDAKEYAEDHAETVDHTIMKYEIHENTKLGIVELNCAYSWNFGQREYVWL